MAIQLCYDDRSYIDFVFESSGLRLTSLTNGGIHHKYYVVRILERERERERERRKNQSRAKQYYGEITIVLRYMYYAISNVLDYCDYTRTCT